MIPPSSLRLVITILVALSMIKNHNAKCKELILHLWWKWCMKATRTSSNAQASDCQKNKSEWRTLLQLFGSMSPSNSGNASTNNNGPVSNDPVPTTSPQSTVPRASRPKNLPARSSNLFKSSFGLEKAVWPNSRKWRSQQHVALSWPNFSKQDCQPPAA